MSEPSENMRSMPMIVPSSVRLGYSADPMNRPFASRYFHALAFDQSVWNS